MKFLTILNRDGGTLRTTDLESFSAQIRSTLEAAGHEVSIKIVDGKGIVEALEEAARDQGGEIMLVGGGDGTVSTAAAILKDSDKALAILPAGTMNLFARGLGIPLDLTEAVHAFANGTVRPVDLASADERIFIHQFSVGMHPTLVRLRDKMNYASRIGKMRASMQAAFLTLLRPPHIRAVLELNGVRMEVVASNISFSNNLFGEGHLPYADMPDKGELGVYITRAQTPADVIRFVLHLVAGRWQDNPEVEIHRCQEATFTLPLLRRAPNCSMDGELCALEEKTVVKILPGALKVLLPEPPSS